jgi:hypothetical protein
LCCSLVRPASRSSTGGSSSGDGDDMMNIKYVI